MKKEITSLANKTASDLVNKPISRKEAIKKTGYIAVSAATMMLLLNTPAQASTSTIRHSHKQSYHQNTNQGGSKENGIWKK